MGKILVVDDDPDIVAGVRQHLEKEGHEISGAQGKSQAMEKALAGDVDLLIIDFLMANPDTDTDQSDTDDGATIVQELRKSGFEKPILMMSNISKVTGLKYDRDDSIMPVDDFLEKPVKAQVLIEKVQSLLNR
jgi:DNA-binding response OmpR family regulator